MMIRTTLNGQPPRTLRDACRDPNDWLEMPERRLPPMRAEIVAAVVFAVALMVVLIGLHAAFRVLP